MESPYISLKQVFIPSMKSGIVQLIHPSCNAPANCRNKIMDRFDFFYLPFIEIGRSSLESENCKASRYKKQLQGFYFIVVTFDLLRDKVKL